VENLNDRYPQEQRSDFSLTRFTVVRNDDPEPDDWECRRACPRKRYAPPGGRGTGGQKAA